MGDSVRDALNAALGCQYDVLRLLGRGGMGSVYLARERSLDRLVAIKVLPPDAFATHESRERFRREARTAAKLSHPNILPLHTFGELNDLGYYVMGYIRGESLAERLKLEGVLPAGEVRRILIELAEALDYAHRHGVIHRDIKPGNVLIEDESGRVVLADFGIAKSHGVDQHLTVTGAVVGTPAYMSPEQLAGLRELDGRSDIYSLGVLAYVMLTGREPFAGATHQELVYRQVMSEPPPLHTLAPAVPADLASAVARCLAKNPSDRWPDARTLKATLGPVGEGEGATAPPELRDLPSFGTFSAIWMLAWWLLALTSAESPVERVLFALFGLFLPVGFLAYVAMIGRKGMRPSQVIRVSFWAPKWWGIWWPRALRRPGDLWSRLPRTARAVRIALAWMFLVLPAAIVLNRADVPFAAASLAAVAGALLVAIAAAFLWWRRATGLSLAETASFLFGPTVQSAYWTAPRVARLLGPAPPAPALAQRHTARPESPRECVRLIAQLAQSLVGPARAVGTEAAEAARQLLAEIHALDHEIAALARDADPAEIERLEQKLAAVAAADAIEVQEHQQMKMLLQQQLDLARRMAGRLEVATTLRARSAEVLTGLCAQLAQLAEAADTSANEQISGRIRALCTLIEEGRAVRDVERVEPAPMAPLSAAPPAL